MTTEPGKPIATIGDSVGASLKGKAKKLGWGDDETPPKAEQSTDDSGDKSNERESNTSGKEDPEMTAKAQATETKTRKRRAPKSEANGEAPTDESDDLEFSNWDHFTEEAAKAAGESLPKTALAVAGVTVAAMAVGKVTGATELVKTGTKVLADMLTGGDEIDEG